MMKNLENQKYFQFVAFQPKQMHDLTKKTNGKQEWFIEGACSKISSRFFSTHSPTYYKEDMNDDFHFFFSLKNREYKNLCPQQSVCYFIESLS
jgi:hypothetical protein